MVKYRGLWHKSKPAPLLSTVTNAVLYKLIRDALIKFMPLISTRLL